ncbi:MAG TPA: hypothetical protein VFT86_08105 [Gaiellaceae bacterium]|nr:hypothetical protein [Gaiellaceae bacterium]
MSARTPDQFIRRKRLDEVVVRPDQQAGNTVERLGPEAGDEENRETLPELLAQLATDLVSGDVRQLNVQHDEIGWRRCDHDRAGRDDQDGQHPRGHVRDDYAGIEDIRLFR